MNIEEKEKESLEIIDGVCGEKPLLLAFSGGKDSTCLLGLLVKYIKNNGDKNVDLEVAFSDTMLEDASLYDFIDIIEEFLSSVEIKFTRVRGKESYWYYQFVRGYGVPNWKLRWCTSYLKINPIDKLKKGKIVLTGRHFGESVTRDNRLKTCGTIDCGIDKIKVSVDPIINWSNCDVWDHIFTLENEGYLPNNTFNSLSSIYDAESTNSKGSLRMGCAFCPVVSKKTLAQNSNMNEALMLTRELLDELALAPRLFSPRAKHKKYPTGPINIFDRRKIWERLPKEALIEQGYMTKKEADDITQQLMESDYRCYPQNYSIEYLKQQHFEVCGLQA